MTVKRGEGGSIVLEGACPLEDAEPLLRLLLDEPRGHVDWRLCDELHTAVVQVLMAAKVSITGSSRSTFLNVTIAPLFNKSNE